MSRPDGLRVGCLLDFLQLQDSYSEKDLEPAILREVEAFILELGVGFTFVARQKRITIDYEDYYIDLLLFSPQARLEAHPPGRPD